MLNDLRLGSSESASQWEPSQALARHVFEDEDSSEAALREAIATLYAADDAWKAADASTTISEHGGFRTPLGRSPPGFWDSQTPYAWTQPPPVAQSGLYSPQPPVQNEFDELSRHLRDVLIQHQRTAEPADHHLLALDTVSMVMGGYPQQQLQPQRQEYSASLVVPSIDRYRKGKVRGGDELSSTILGSDVPTELKLDTIHPEGRGWFHDAKRLESDVDDDDEEEDDDESELPLSTRNEGPATAPPPAVSNNLPIHTVPPASLACRKRLTLTGCRGTKCLRRLMTQLSAAVKIGDWEEAWKHTRTFAMCSESDNEYDDEDNEDDEAGSIVSEDLTEGTSSIGRTETDSVDASMVDMLKKARTEWIMLRPSDVMSYNDFINMCSSCFHRLPVKSIGLPRPVEDSTTASAGARDLRQLLCDVETILLMCLASKIDLEPAEKLKLKNVVASLIFLLSWHPSMMEAITIIFLKLRNQTNNDCFCSFLSRWTFTTNAVQILFEVFCLILMRQKRYFAFLLVLSATEHGSSFIEPLLSRPEVAAQMADCLPEVGPIVGTQNAVIESLRVPCYAIQIFLHDLIVKKDIIPNLNSEEIILSILPLVTARPFSDEMLISRGWHYRAIVFGPPIDSFEPAKVLVLLAEQTREVEENLLTELEYGARAVVTHAIPHYLLLGSPEIASEAYAYLKKREMPVYCRDILPPLKLEGDDTPSDHPVNHLPFEYSYRNALVRLGNCFLENTVEITIDSLQKIEVPLIIMQSLCNELVAESLQLADLESVAVAANGLNTSRGLWWLGRDIIHLVNQLHSYPVSGRRAYQIQELMSRLTERFFVTSSVNNGRISPFEEAVNSCNTHQKGNIAGGSFGDHNSNASGHQPSYLQIVKRTMLEHTGCTLGRIDLCYLRLLENYETIYGKGSCFSTVLLLCKKRRFEQGVLNVDNHIHYMLLCPYLSGGVAGGYVKPDLFPEKGGDNSKERTCAIANDVYPTLLPNHVAKLLPAWLAGRALQDPPRKNTSTSLIGWKLLGLELNIAASQVGSSGYGTGDVTYATHYLGEPEKCKRDQPSAVIEKVLNPRDCRHVAPHLDPIILMTLILLYAECGNPRAIHLIAKVGERKNMIETFAAKAAEKTGLTKLTVLERLKKIGCGRIPYAVPSLKPVDNMSMSESREAFAEWVLSRGYISRFVLLGDMFARLREPTEPRILEKVLLIYLGGEDLIRCRRIINRCPELKEKYAKELEQLRLRYQHVKNGRQGRSPMNCVSGASTPTSPNAQPGNSPSLNMSYNKDEKLKESLAIVKKLALMDDVDGAIDYFYQLRNSEGGLLDISVGNKILHLCVINGKLKKAEEILETLRNDAHCEINAIDFIPGSCVRPDVVTCNIIIKGMARDRNSSTRLQEIKDFILHMEKPFHLGGDGVKPDQVTFHAVINAAVSANDLQMTWDLFNMMLERNIKIDSYTCNLVAEQLCKGVAAANAAKQTSDTKSSSDEGETLSNMITKFCTFVEQNDITNYDDNVNLLRNIVEMYSKKDSARLKKFLDAVSAKIMNKAEIPKSDRCCVDPQELAVLMAGYGKCGKVNKVNTLWKQLEGLSKDFKWTTFILGNCIEAFAAIKDVNMVITLAEKARKLSQSSPSCRPLTAAQYSAIIRTCVAHQKQAEALNYYNVMKQHNLSPNEMAYNALIHSCVQTGDLNTALSILNEMGRGGKSDIKSSHSSVQPDIVTYSTIIKGLCDGGAMEAAYELFESLPAKGLVRDSVTYNTILEGYARLGDTKAVERVFGDMMASLNGTVPNGHPPVRPTCYTLTILVKFYGRKRQVDHVINLVEVLPSLGKFKLDSYVYTAVIAACAWNNRIQEAYDYLVQMRLLFGCGSRTYGTLVSGCIKNCNCGILKLVLQLLIQDKTKLDKREVTALRDLLKQYTSHTLNPLWLHSGFNHETAEIIRQVVNFQRKALGSNTSKTTTSHVRTIVLRPKAKASAPVAKPKPAPARAVSWSDDVVDNELLNKRKSKICCIHEKKRQLGDPFSSDEEDECCRKEQSHAGDTPPVLSDSEA